MGKGAKGAAGYQQKEGFIHGRTGVFHNKEGICYGPVMFCERGVIPAKARVIGLTSTGTAQPSPVAGIGLS